MQSGVQSLLIFESEVHCGTPSLGISDWRGWVTGVCIQVDFKGEHFKRLHLTFGQSQRRIAVYLQFSSAFRSLRQFTALAKRLRITDILILDIGREGGLPFQMRP